MPGWQRRMLTTGRSEKNARMGEAHAHYRKKKRKRKNARMGEAHKNNSNNNSTLHSSQREIKAVVRSHNEERISIILKSRNTHTYTLLDIRPLSLSAYTNNSKPKITWRFTHPQPSLRKLFPTAVLTLAHAKLMTGITFIKN